MEKTNKVMRIVLSVVTFVAIALVVVGVLALPLEARSAGSVVVETTTIYGFIQRFADFIKSIPEAGESILSSIPGFVILMLVIVLTAVFGIMAIVQGIILVIKTIKGMSGKGELSPVLKSLAGFGITIVVYISLFLGAIYSKEGETVTSLGSGAEMMLSGGLMTLVIAGVYHIAVKDERKLLNKILGFGVATLVLVALVVGLTVALTSDGGVKSYGLFEVVNAFMSYMMSGSVPDGKTVFALALSVVGMVIVLVSVGFAKSVIFNAFHAEVMGKKPDFEKSSIVKSALFFGFSVIGFILIVVPLSKNGYGMGAGAIVSMVFGALALGAAIANKIISGKAAAPKAEEPKEEAKAE